MVFIPAGEFVMGSDDEDTEGLAKEFGLRKGDFYADEKPMRKVFVDDFFIDRFEVANSEYKRFLEVNSYNPPQHWEEGRYPDGTGRHPVNNVTWFDAVNYCRFVGARLPTEAEWEKAAKGDGAGGYTWGDEYDEEKANLGTGVTAPVGSFETDKSPYGVYDMSGNVMEWVDDWYAPYTDESEANKDFGKQYRVLRGGSATVGHYIMSKILARTTNRHYYRPDGAGPDGGFRCASAMEIE